MRKLLFLLLPLLVFTACQKAPEKKNTFRLNLVDDPVSLDPRVVRSLKDLTVVKQLFDGLMRLDGDGVPQPAIAEKVELSDDSKTYTFTLRETSWTNGDPVTADDFKYAWSKVLDPEFMTDYSHMLYPIKNARQIREGKMDLEQLGVTALDDRILVVELESPTPYFLELLAFPTSFPVNRFVDEASSIWNSPPGTDFVSNGPFQLMQWNVGSSLELVKNEGYWDADSVQLDGISLSVITDNNTESQLFDKNELDWLGQPVSANIATELIGKFNREGKLRSYPIAGTHWIKLNTDRPPFNEVRMRRAFGYAINRADIITHILQGNQTIATGPVPPSMALDEEGYFADGDTIKAKELFEEALADLGWDRDSFPKIVLNYAPFERDVKIAQLIQQQWQQAFGIPVRLEVTENQLYRRNVREGHYQAGLGSWIGDYNDPISFLDLFQYPNDVALGSGMNDTRWHNKQYAALIDDSMAENEPGRRRELLHQAEKILVSEMPLIPLYHYAFDYVKKDHIEGVVLLPTGTADFKNVRINMDSR